VREQPPAVEANGPRRRSTRILREVPLVVTWAESGGKARREETATVSINCHGCKYFSRFRLRKNTKVTLEVGSTNSTPRLPGRKIDARVASLRKSSRLPGMYQVGVEFETPEDIWHLGESPQDWTRFAVPRQQDLASFVSEVESILQLGHAGTYYELLGVQSETPRADVKRRFYQLARRFHPDHNMDRREMTPRLEAVMDLLTLAYKTLSDDRAKKKYDLQLAQAGALKAASGSAGGQPTEQYIENARACLGAKNYAGSILWMRRAVEMEPNSSTYRAMLGVSLIQVPEYRREALEQFEIAVGIDPHNIEAHYQYAQALEKMKLLWRARLHYRRVLEIDPQHREARENLIRLDAIGPRSLSRPSLLDRLTGRRRK
jgi:curved DNA-binding protein CbpA